MLRERDRLRADPARLRRTAAGGRQKRLRPDGHHRRLSGGVDQPRMPGADHRRPHPAHRRRHESGAGGALREHRPRRSAG